jgi:hypothetical protein
LLYLFEVFLGSELGVDLVGNVVVVLGEVGVVFGAVELSEIPVGFGNAIVHAKLLHLNQSVLEQSFSRIKVSTTEFVFPKAANGSCHARAIAHISPAKLPIQPRTPGQYQDKFNKVNPLNLNFSPKYSHPM